MFSQGVDPELDFSDMPYVTSMYKSFTAMPVSPRHPYAGELVFAAFSGSHQDAIAKGMAFRQKTSRKVWDVPYLPIDPSDVGREYQTDVIRINSQSGKGGVGFIMLTNYGIDMPAKMKEDMGYKVKDLSDKRHKELKPSEVYSVFEDSYLTPRAHFDIADCHFKQTDGIEAALTLDINGKAATAVASGNGRLDAVSNAVKSHFGLDYVLTGYEQHALTDGSRSQAISYVGVEKGGKTFWGAGVDNDVIKSGYMALISAVNNLLNK